MCDVEVDSVGQLFSLVNIVKEHDKDVGFGAFGEADFDLSVPLSLLWAELLLLKNSHQIVGMYLQVLFSAEELCTFNQQTGVLNIVLTRVRVGQTQGALILMHT